MALATFPEFGKLHLEDKVSYGHLISKWPSVSDISFPTLHIWWDIGGQLRLSSLGDNLVLKYHQDFDEENSGYSLIGTSNIDSSIVQLLAYLRANQQPERVVHVPEFVIDRIENKHRYEISEEQHFHEYILDSQGHAELAGGDYFRIRRKINRLKRELEGSTHEIKILDLDDSANHRLILDHLMDWHHKYPTKNDPGRTEDVAIKRSLSYTSQLGIQNLCFYVNDHLKGVVLYHKSTNHQYFIIHHIKVDYGTPFVYDYMVNQLAIEALKHDVPLINIEMDLGIEGLRQHKTDLKPIKFIKKFTVRPI